MNTIKITKKLNQALIDYLTTTFDVNKDGMEPELAFEIRKSFERPEALFNGPFIELILPYQTGSSIEELCAEGVLSNKILELECMQPPNPRPIPRDVPLYTHQQKAILKLIDEGKSIVVSAGTGSGKTEAFTLPIISDLLQDDSPGVRALLVYPLNALVNDQLDRLRTLLRGTEITFGLFTGELPERKDRTSDILPNEIVSRHEIRVEKKVPQILITNYAMLEYLLLRPEDSIIFQNGLWKFLVFDEAHTYAGAQGTEVAMLVRRLKERLGKKPGEVRCIATSATLINDDAQLAVDFAHNLFGEDFTEDEIIFGEPDHSHIEKDLVEGQSYPGTTYLHHDFEKLISEIRRDQANLETISLFMNEIGLAQDAILDFNLETENISSLLYKALSHNIEIQKLRSWMLIQSGPVSSFHASQYLFPELDDEDSIQALYNLVELGAIARPGLDQLPLLPAKYHLFARPPQGIWACLNPDCSDRHVGDNSDIKWSKIFSMPHDVCDSCGSKVYPIHICRQCGQVFIAAHKDFTEYRPATDTNEEVDKRYFTWRIIETNIALADLTEEEYSDDDPDNPYIYDGAEFKQDQITICLSCCRDKAKCTCDSPIYSIDLFDIQLKSTKKNSKKQTLERWLPVGHMNKCVRCGSSSKKETEISTSIAIHGTAPLANLTFELYRQLPISSKGAIQNLPGNGRKLLTFYDSRQGAARFAAYLQDVANKQNYRHIIPVAIDLYIMEKGFEPSFNGLTEYASKLALDNKIVQNDSDMVLFWRKKEGGRFSRGEREKAKEWIAKQILGEITTGRRGRQSLESLALINIRYFEQEDDIDFSNLAADINLTVEQANTLVHYLLDGLRTQKILELPFGIEADDPVFGPHKGNAKLFRQEKPNKWNELWIGKTNRQARRKYIELVLHQNRLDYSEVAVEDVLTKIWDFLVDQADVFEGDHVGGFRLMPERLFFNTDFDVFRCEKCLRYSTHGDTLPCPAPHCGGEIQKFDSALESQNNYYYNLFHEKMIPVRVEEHTAQLDPELGKIYQDNFKKGRINILSCSTTFEMGIDLGELQAVVMSNVPPSVANYRQRSGRAGRRTSGTAFILTWASERPHDQTYYSNPSEIIGGEVAVPRIFLENNLIIRRHANAILLSLFLRWRVKQETDSIKSAGHIFDVNNQEHSQFEYLDEWRSIEYDKISHALAAFNNMLLYSSENFIEQSLDAFETKLKKINDGHYQEITNYYIKQIEEFAEKSKNTNISSKESEELRKAQKRFRNLLDRYRNESLINYLSDRGFLPSYSFPLHTVELILPNENRLRLKRDLKQAIREYAPGSEIVADKRIWKSERPLFYKDTVRDISYRICENCKHLEVSKGPGIPLPESSTCKICGELFRNVNKRFVIPDDFWADKNSGKPAKQYVKVEPNQMRSAILPIQNPDEVAIGEMVRVAYEREGQLLHVNEGKFGKGFYVSLSGFNISDSSKENKARVSLGHIQPTDTLHIRFIGNEFVRIPQPEDHSFWYSLMYAIIHAASHALQIEKRDIDGVLSPRKIGDKWEQTIVLYDNVPGGAGHVRNIRDQFGDVIQDAIRVLSCVDCAQETSCHHCLRDYNNQSFHDLLVRKDALRFLEIIIEDIKPFDSEVHGANKVITANPNTWVFRKIEETRKSLYAAVDKIDLGHPYGENYTWFDTLYRLLARGCDVNLYIKERLGKSPLDLSISKHLQVILERGGKIFWINDLPEWQIIIDPEDFETQRSIGQIDGVPIKFSDTIGSRQMVTSIIGKGVEFTLDRLVSQNSISVDMKQLETPPSTRVINLPSIANSNQTVETLFSEVFSKPIKSVSFNDPYLLSYEQIHLLDPFMELLEKHDQLEAVTVYTKDAGTNYRHIQHQAESEIIQKFTREVKFNHNYQEHDRYILINRVNGEKARIIIGRGLEFMRPDGGVKSTFIVIEDPLVK